MIRSETSREELIGELETLRQRVAELEEFQTEHQRGEETQPQIEADERYRAILESSDDGLLVLDRKDRVIDANEKLEEIIGYERRELVGRTILSLARLLTNKGLTVLWRNPLKRTVGVNVAPYEVDVFKKDGQLVTVQIKYHPFKSDGIIIGRLVILRDVNARTRAEKESRESQEVYRSLFNHVEVGVFRATPGATGRFLEVNPAMEEITGYSREELLQLDVAELYVHPEERADIVKEVLSGMPVKPREVHFKKKDGTEILVRDKKVAIRGNDSKTLYLEGFLEDITKGKREEDEILQKSSEIKLINTMNEAANQGSNFEEIIQLLEKETTKFFGGKLATIYLLSNDKQYLVMQNLNLPPNMAHIIEKLIGMKIPAVRIKLKAGGIYTEILKAGKAQLVNDPSVIERMASEFTEDKTLQKLVSPILKSLGVSSVISVPVESDGEVLGLLDISGHEPFTESDMKKIEIISGQFVRVIKHKQAEDALRQSEERLHAMMEASSEGFAMHNGERIFDINNNGAYMFGFERSEMIGKTMSDIVAPESLDLVSKNIAARHEQPYEAMFKKKDGSTFAVETRARNITYKGRDIRLVSFRDLTAQKQYTNLLENISIHAPIGMFIVQNGRYKFVNKQFCQDTGYPEQELLSMDIMHGIHPEDCALVLNNTIQMLKGERIAPYEFRIIHKNGEVRCVLQSVTPITFVNQRAYLATYLDITEKRKTEMALIKSEQNLKQAQTLGRIGNWEFDLATQKIEWSDEVYTLYERNKAIGPPSPEEEANYYLPEQSRRLREYVRLAIEKGGKYNCDLTANLPSGKTAFFNSYVYPIQDDNGQTIKLFGTVQDITERKQVEEKLEQAAQEWRTTFDSITDLISIHDKNNRIVRVNKAMADVLKTTPKELVGKFCHEVMHGAKEPPVTCPHWRTLINGKPSLMEAFNPNLGIHLYESASPLFNEKGEITGSVIIARDVTKQKRMEEQMIMTDRLASIGELSSGIAHELNNPLTSVIGFSQLLLEGDVPANMKEDLGIVYSEAQRAAVIVKNLLTFARKHAPVKSLSQVNAVIEDVLRLRAYEQKVNNIEIENRLASNLPEIMIDHFQMQQVFLNIIVNAEFAMMESHHRGKLTITTKKSDSFIKIAITDDGPGIAKENLKHIFDPFFTTKEVGKGTGLGLSICHGIVTEHGGQIYARSEKGQGATFVVELPLINEQ
jgi:PAS domain S-box-containing protein